LQTADATLSSVVTTLQRAISLGIQGANDTLSDANRLSIAQDVTGIQQQLLGLANLSFQGRFVFAGTNSKTPPFVVDATQASGVRYDENAVVNAVEVGEGFRLQVTFPGLRSSLLLRVLYFNRSMTSLSRCRRILVSTLRSQPFEPHSIKLQANASSTEML
jgi:flagellin-like protein